MIKKILIYWNYNFLIKFEHKYYAKFVYSFWND